MMYKKNYIKIMVLYRMILFHASLCTTLINISYRGLHTCLPGAMVVGDAENLL